MKKTLSKLWFYFFWLIWAGSVWVINHFFALAPWTIFLTFFLLILLPGFCLARIFKFRFEEDYLGQIILFLTLGFTAICLLIFGTMFFGLTIFGLLNVFIIFMGFLFLLSFIFDFFIWKETFKPIKISFRDIFQVKNLNFFLVFSLILFVLLIVTTKGSLFRGGDPNFHLSILRKVSEGSALTPENLGFTKSKLIHIAYGFPVWHIFLGLLIKISRTDIFNLWGEIVLPLTTTVFLVWYWLFQRIFSNRNLVILAFLLFILFSFTWDTGYLFTTLPIPHTLSQLILLPLAIGLTLKYIFDKNLNYKFLFCLSIFLILTAIIHLTQYFYYTIIMVFFVLVFALLRFGDYDFKEIFKKTLLTIFANMIIILPFIIFLEVKSHVISAIWKSLIKADFSPPLRYRSFISFNYFAKYAYLTMPLILLFIKKNRQLIFLFTLFLITPIAYSETIGFIRTWLLRFLRHVFMNRLYGTVTWHFAVWALILGFLMILIDRFISRMAKISKYSRYLINFTFLFSAGYLVWAQTESSFLTGLYAKVFSKDMDKWLNEHYLWILLFVIILVTVLLFWQKRQPKIVEFFRLEEIKNPLPNFFLSFMLIIFFLGPNYKSIDEILKQKKISNIFFQPAQYELVTLATNYSGGQETVAFIKDNLPVKSVILVPESVSRYMPLLLDQFMVAYARSLASQEYSKIYRPDISPEEKLSLLAHSQSNYVMLTKPGQGKTFFDSFPEYFQMIFQNNKAFIYQVNLQKLQKEAKSYTDDIE